MRAHNRSKDRPESLILLLRSVSVDIRACQPGTSLMEPCQAPSAAFGLDVRYIRLQCCIRHDITWREE